MLRGRRIVVLLHRRQRERELRHYLIKHLADLWRSDGLDVVFLSGPDEVVAADALIVHVDLSVVPDDYLEFARQYRVALNGRVKDIRKASFSTQLVRVGDGYRGRVIVKTNLNYGGEPERRLDNSGIGSLMSRIGSSSPGSRIAQGLGRVPRYAIFERPDLVPRRFFDTDAYVVERFLPETEDGSYFIRSFDFLGDCATCLRIESKHPVIRGTTVIAAHEVEPAPEVWAWREQLELDYGKLDYVVRDGEVVLLDVNKTSGAGAIPLASGTRGSRRRYWANGIYAYLDDGAH